MIILIHIYILLRVIIFNFFVKIIRLKKKLNFFKYSAFSFSLETLEKPIVDITDTEIGLVIISIIIASIILISLNHYLKNKKSKTPKKVIFPIVIAVTDGINVQFGYVDLFDLTGHNFKLLYTGNADLREQAINLRFGNIEKANAIFFKGSQIMSLQEYNNAWSHDPVRWMVPIISNKSMYTLVEVAVPSPNRAVWLKLIELHELEIIVGLDHKQKNLVPNLNNLYYIHISGAPGTIYPPKFGKVFY
jgi:hypothetical protein